MAKTKKIVRRKPQPSLVVPNNLENSTNVGSTVSSSSSPVTPITPKTPADEGIEFFQSDLHAGESPIRVYELHLDPDGGPDSEKSYIRLPPAYTPYVLRVILDAGTPAARNGIFKTNFPLDGGVFGRDNFAERRLPDNFSKPVRVDLPISHAGAFMYWIEYDSDTPGERIKGREGYFNIDPILRTKSRKGILSSGMKPLSVEDGGAVITRDNVNIPLDGLSILTVVSKWMGPLSAWKKHFAEARDRGYTMLHYTPLQERGESDSPFSIRDQSKYDPSLFNPGTKSDDTVTQIREILRVAKEDYGLLSLTDVVLNHTANDSPWLIHHPEAGYSPANTPHLTPAWELDSALIEFSGSLSSKNLPVRITSHGDLEKIVSALSDHIKTLHFWQYYVLDVNREKVSVKTALSTKVPEWGGPDVAAKSVVELAEILRRCDKVQGLGKFASRFGVRVDGGVAASLVKAAFVDVSDEDGLVEAWARIVDVLNVPLYQEWEEDTRVALENIRNRVKYTRLDEKGPRLGEITKHSPLVEPYFTRLSRKASEDPLKYSLANNGWIWNANPLQNFAQLPSKAYLRREVIAWCDCVKLRYGEGPQDNPWLWSHMISYVTSLARTFDGFRIDNCHSTPLHVGVVLLDAARVVNPDLYVAAELFTADQEKDIVFVSRLGINSLIREAGHGCSPKEFSGVLYSHGLGKPIGSMDETCMTNIEELQSPTGKGPIRSCIVSALNGSKPHSLLYDATHDNESLLDKRSAEDALSTGALVTFSYSAIGSTKGFDDLYPKLLDLVTENRKYEITGIGDGSGIAPIKRVLNALHLEMVMGGFTEGHVHQENDYIMLHRLEPSTHKGYLLIAHTAFSKGSKDRGSINPIKLRRTRVQFIMGASIDVKSYEPERDPSTLRGLPSTLYNIPHIVVPQGLDEEGPFSEIIVPEHFPPGSILVFGTQLQQVDTSLDRFCVSNAQNAFSELGLLELNAMLYRADGEERDATKGEFGAYDIPGHGELVYCGLEGWMHPLRHIMRYNDLGHPLCAHLREGTWAFDYVHARLFRQTEALPKLIKPAQWFKERFECIKKSAPNFLRPKYFALVIAEAYKNARQAAVEQSSEFVLAGPDFTRALAMCSVQMHGLVSSSSLDPAEATPSLAAGLPHFAAGWARCWGRDVFISLRGLFLTTGNFEAAKTHILAFASTLNHGLIPNLLDSGRKPRFNSRDSPWWMLQSIQDYVKSAPDGISLLSEPVKRRFPKDESWVPWDDPSAYSYTSTVAEIIHTILQRHAEGISFREHNAGPDLDSHMTDTGFNIEIKVDWTTGFIFGGNRHNCGTWMDKMGESEKAGTKGIPGTPRDGAPVEITGLLKSTLRWLSELSKAGNFPFRGVTTKIEGREKFVTYREWESLIQKSFERCYYIPLDPNEDARYDITSSLVHIRGIYKDVYGSGSGREWSDYQFRPNFPVAMTVAPELFDEKHALHALRLTDKVLRGPLGMKSLDPSDLQYRPMYDNSNDSTDAAIAKGLNYHNGPEWGWPLGYFLRAYLYFDTRVGTGREDSRLTLHYLYRILLSTRRYIRNDPWAGIPELTNADGEFCRDSCNTQAWSASTLLDFLETVHSMQIN